MGTVWHESHHVSLGFSRVDGSAPDIARAAMLYGNNIPISGQADSRESVPYKEKVSFATILPPEPKNFGFPGAACRVIEATPADC